jgi:hypothetical protein
VVLAVAACIPSNLGVLFTLVLHDRLVPTDARTDVQQMSIEQMFAPANPYPWRAGTYPIRSQLDSTPMAYPDSNESDQLGCSAP